MKNVDYEALWIFCVRMYVKSPGLLEWRMVFSYPTGPFKRVWTTGWTKKLFLAGIFLWNGGRIIHWMNVKLPSMRKWASSQSEYFSPPIPPLSMRVERPLGASGVPNTPFVQRFPDSYRYYYFSATTPNSTPMGFRFFVFHLPEMRYVAVPPWRWMDNP
jgi:hypothetical protein